MMRKIVLIKDQTAQGKTSPFICEAEDGVEYVVKGRGVAREGIIAEWICAALGKSLGFPIPDCEIMELDGDLAGLAANPNANLLNRFPLFCSKRVPFADEFDVINSESVPVSIRAKILLFDHWIANGDRTQHNPNLLWVANEARLFVIDHNLAFDAEVRAPVGRVEFWDSHLFRTCKAEWTQAFRDEMEPLMERAILDLPRLFDELPEQWTEDLEAVTLESVRNLLTRHRREREAFWSPAT